MATFYLHFGQLYSFFNTVLLVFFTVLVLHSQVLSYTKYTDYGVKEVKVSCTRTQQKYALAQGGIKPLRFGFVDKCSTCRVHKAKFSVSTSTKWIKCCQIV